MENSQAENGETKEDGIRWNDETFKQFEFLVGKIPVFLRGMAKEKILKKIKSIVAAENRVAIGEKDMVDAFFAETPFGFHGPLKVDMEEIDLDYTKYGYPR